MTRICNDNLLNVLSFLDYKSVGRLAGVSHQWRSQSDKTFKNVRKIEIRNYEFFKYWKSFVRKFDWKNMREIILHGTFDGLSKYFYYQIFPKKTRLETLIFASYEGINAEKLRILSRAKHLKKLDLGYHATESFPPSFIDAFPKLEYLYGYFHMARFMRTSSPLSNLKDIANRDSGFHADEWVNILKKVGCLENSAFYGAKSIEDNHALISATAHKIKSLSISVPINGIVFSNVTSLKIHSYYERNPEVFDLTNISEQFPSLESLSLDRETQLSTSLTVKDLKILNSMNCEEIIRYFPNLIKIKTVDLFGQNEKNKNNLIFNYITSTQKRIKNISMTVKLDKQPPPCFSNLIHLDYLSISFVVEEYKAPTNIFDTLITVAENMKERSTIHYFGTYKDMVKGDSEIEKLQRFVKLCQKKEMYIIFPYKFVMSVGVRKYEYVPIENGWNITYLGEKQPSYM